MKTKKEIAEKIAEDFDYTVDDLLTTWTWIEVEADPGMFGNIYFDGKYVLFAEDKVIWY